MRRWLTSNRSRPASEACRSISGQTQETSPNPRRNHREDRQVMKTARECRRSRRIALHRQRSRKCRDVSSAADVLVLSRPRYCSTGNGPLKNCAISEEQFPTASKQCGRVAKSSLAGIIDIGGPISFAVSGEARPAASHVTATASPPSKLDTASRRFVIDRAGHTKEYLIARDIHVKLSQRW